MAEPAGLSRRLVFLGSGTSTGVPVLGCDCTVCQSSDARNSRTRPSVLMSFPQGNLLIDTTPEMRLQLLRERIRLVHAIAFTHYHVDHLFGLDDARLFPKYLGRAVPIFCEADTEATIRRVFDYAFHEKRARDSGAGNLPKGSSSSGSRPVSRLRPWAKRYCPSASITAASRCSGFGSATWLIALT